MQQVNGLSAPTGTQGFGINDMGERLLSIPARPRLPLTRFADKGAHACKAGLLAVRSVFS